MEIGFFDREVELQLLRERVENGTHTLLTAQRRMGKTSLVRELLRQLDEDGEFATVFVDLEGGYGRGGRRRRNSHTSPPASERPQTDNVVVEQ